MTDPRSIAAERLEGAPRPGRRRLAPPKDKLAEYRRRGLSLAQMVDEWERESGRRLRITTLSAALSRAGLTAPVATHRRAIPWRLIGESDQRHRHAQMLRVMSRKVKGLPISDLDRDRLESWLRHVDGHRVAYIDSPRYTGFKLVRDESVPPELKDPVYPIVLMDAKGRPFTDAELKEFEAQDAEALRHKLRKL